MLNSDTKRHIDAARDVLVGVAPNPTTQIDQITYALIYKFMDDMDQASVKVGGEASFFVGNLEKYAWSNLMSTRLGNQEKMDLYSEALTKFSEAKQLPELFRTIFRAAFLPYRSPETLGLFLKEISYFDYTHPEELGNAYEYLLSIMSSQGDAGQFRTPRHIIDFIVDVINPTKDDKVLDPACGTGGFLVSTYNHILEQHDGKDDPKKKEKPLTPDERKKLMSNLQGYDIDPTMVRIAQVNMYLHQFKNPQIFQYDSLTSEERWNDKYDVILANPPFMTPKGGIKPHNKFGVSSNRAEVLFVDYILSHLKPKGRAGIVIPEGVVFQSGKAYRELRKNLLENGLYAVVSLPGGVFQPYSGVKTSILLIDSEISKQKAEVAFVRIGADGFDLGATKRPISQNDLPSALKYLRYWATGKTIDNPIFSLVGKNEIAEKGDYNLSGERYKVGPDYSQVNWPIVTLDDVALIKKGSSITQKDTSEGSIPVIAGGQKPAYFHNVSNRDGNVITVSASGAYAGFVNYFDTPIYASDCSTIQSKDESQALTRYIYLVLKGLQEEIYKFQQGGGQPHVYPKDLVTIEIPLPPLEVQAQLVAEFDGYAVIISGAKQIVENWRPFIPINSEYRMMKISDLIQTVIPPKKIASSDYSEEGALPIIDQSQMAIAGWSNDLDASVYSPDGLVVFGDHTCCIKFADFPFVQGADGIKILKTNELIIPKFLYYYLLAHPFHSSGYKRHFTEFKELSIGVPLVEHQLKVIESIDREFSYVKNAQELIRVYEDRIKHLVNSFWE